MRLAKAAAKRWPLRAALINFFAERSEAKKRRKLTEERLHPCPDRPAISQAWRILVGQRLLRSGCGWEKESKTRKNGCGEPVSGSLRPVVFGSRGSLRVELHIYYYVFFAGLRIAHVAGGLGTLAAGGQFRNIVVHIAVIVGRSEKAGLPLPLAEAINLVQAQARLPKQ